MIVVRNEWWVTSDCFSRATIGYDNVKAEIENMEVSDRNKGRQRGMEDEQN